MKSKGKEGEDIALKYLLDRGYELLERNYRYRRGEIDLIVRTATVIHFIEVKFRKNNRYGEPEDFVSQKQQGLIMEAADNFVLENEWKGDIRFDIIAIKMTGQSNKIEITHLKDAFY